MGFMVYLEGIGVRFARGFGGVLAAVVAAAMLGGTCYHRLADRFLQERMHVVTRI